jgi:hypothetical protein
MNVGLNASPKSSHLGFYSSGDQFGFGSAGLGLGLSVGGLGGFGSSSLGGLGTGLYNPMSSINDGQIGGQSKAVGGPATAATITAASSGTRGKLKKNCLTNFKIAGSLELDE